MAALQRASDGERGRDGSRLRAGRARRMECDPVDVHARKVVAGALDASTGELRSLRAPTLPAETVEWLQRFRVPVRVAYEAGSDRVWPGAGVRGGRDRVHRGGAVKDPARPGGPGQD